MDEALGTTDSIPDQQQEALKVCDHGNVSPVFIVLALHYGHCHYHHRGHHHLITFYLVGAGSHVPQTGCKLRNSPDLSVSGLAQVLDYRCVSSSLTVISIHIS